MKTILVTAYAMNPYKGSEDGMGWNFICQIARHHRVIAITRKNNAPHIDRYRASVPGSQEIFDRIRFIYFDWPWWLRWWKKGPLLSMIYFYGWQLTLAVWLFFRRPAFDIAHNLNFHNDWTPTFLWILGKPLVWGPVGHHPKIPKEFLLPVYGKKEYRKDRLLWGIKQFFWHADPFLRIAVRKAGLVICMNSKASGPLRLKAGQFRIIPSVAAEDAGTIHSEKPPGFTVLSAGRFVPLKGFDLTIRSFARFYHRLTAEGQATVKLVLVGSGPQKSLLQQMIAAENIGKAVQIIEWIPRAQLLELYDRSHVFLFPSHEGAGMVVAEAMSHGLPVVCLDNSGPGEFLHPDSSLAIQYGPYERTVLDLAGKLEQLYGQPEFYRSESAWALRRFHEYLCWGIRGAQLREIYHSVSSLEIKNVSDEKTRHHSGSFTQ